MKSIFKKSMAVTIVVFMLILTAIPFASAATLLDESKKVSFKVQSGNYFIAELEAPEGYNVYGKVIPISVEVSYLDAFTNNTWVENAPKDGFASVTVTDTKLIVPQTGGYVQYVYLAGVISLLIGGTMFLVSRRIKNR